MEEAWRSQSLFPSRITSRRTSPMCCSARRSGAHGRTWWTKFSVFCCCEAPAQEKPSLAALHVRAQSEGCGTAPESNCSSSTVTCPLKFTGASGRKNARSAHLWLSQWPCCLMCSAWMTLSRTSYLAHRDPKRLVRQPAADTPSNCFRASKSAQNAHPNDQTPPHRGGLSDNHTGRCAPTRTLLVPYVANHEAL